MSQTVSVLMVPSHAAPASLCGLEAALSACLHEPVHASTAEQVLAWSRTLLEKPADRVVLLPVMPEDTMAEQLVRLLRPRLPKVRILSAPAPTLAEWADVISSALPSGAGAILAAPAKSNPAYNARISELAWWVARDKKVTVLPGFVGAEFPGIDESREQLAKQGLDAPAVMAAWPGLVLSMGTVPVDLTSPVWVACLGRHHAEALQADAIDTDCCAVGVSGVDAEALLELEKHINNLLPPLYQGRYNEISPKSMGTASLIYGSDEKVAWDRVWTTFCDLALAGGPAHRGTLLEAVPISDVLSDLTAYGQVVEEIQRGIRLATSLPIVPSASPGWVGVQCESEAMAVWLLRAIIVENIMVRREGTVLYLPAGPRFRITREIKNVITAVAKTHHYWIAHSKVRKA